MISIKQPLQYDIKKPICNKSGNVININGIRKLMNMTFINKPLEEVRDLWMLSFYLMGLDIREILCAKPDNVMEGIFLASQGTDKDLIPLPLVDEALEIFEKYSGTYYALRFLEKDYTPSAREALTKASRFRFNINRQLDIIKIALKFDCSLSFENIRLAWYFAAKEVKLNERYANIINEFVAQPHKRKLINGKIENIANENNKLIKHLLGYCEAIEEKKDVNYPLKLEDGSMLMYKD